MKFILILSFCITYITSGAQKMIYAKLQLVYPVKLTYDTLLVKERSGKALFEISNLITEGKQIRTYRINADSNMQSSFSIYFGGSSSAVNDTLYFLSHGKNLLIELKDSFALRNRIHFKLKNVYNFEQLYAQYNQYYNLQMQKYDSLLKINPAYPLSKQQYSLKAAFDFVKKNLNNPYTVDLFAVFIINPPLFHVEYSRAYDFYTKILKNKIQDSSTKTFVENKIEELKQALNEGRKSPSFSARSIKGELINSNILLGKNVLLIFWATWCPPCMKEIPYLKQINEEYKGDNLVMVSVSLDRDSIKMAKEINKNKLNWINIFNSSSMLEAFRINPIPAIFLIDEDGVILYNNFMQENETDDLQILRSLLKHKFKH